MKFLQQSCFKDFGVSLEEKTAKAISLLREHEADARKLDPEGYFLAFSGGKDSIVIERLASMSGVKYHSHYSQTTIDPPELVRFIKDFYPNVAWIRPRENFFKAVERKGPPSRLVRWCCEKYKESAGDGKYKILGVRAAESVKRAKTWKEVTPWRGGLGGLVIAPIVRWSHQDVWDFIHHHNMPYCTLYDEGWKRLGCIGCPMAGAGRIREFIRWPRFRDLWIRSIERNWESHVGKKNRYGENFYCMRFKSGREFYDWWISENSSAAPDENNECLGLWDDLESDNSSERHCTGQIVEPESGGAK